MKSSTLRWLGYDVVPLVAWMGLIFALSSRPTLISIEDQLEAMLFYKTAHVIFYAMLAWLWWRALAPQRQMTWQLFGTVFVLTTLYGISDEIHQLYVPGRSCRLADVFFDASGAWAMLLLIRWEWQFSGTKFIKKARQLFAYPYIFLLFMMLVVALAVMDNDYDT